MDALEAAISARNAAWWSAGVSAFSALATLLAVAAAFLVQLQQHRYEAAVREGEDAKFRQALRMAIRACVDQVTELTAEFEADLANLDIQNWRAAVETRHAVVEYYLGRDLPDPHFVAAFVILRDLLSSALNSLNAWQVASSQGPTSPFFQDELRRIARERASRAVRLVPEARDEA